MLIGLNVNAVALLGSLLLLWSPLVKATGASSHQTVVDVAARDIRFSTLVASLTATRLTDTLYGQGPYTLFAPTNAAWVFTGVNITRLLGEEWNAHLTDLLMYHVAFGKIPASDSSLGESVLTLNDEPIQVTSVGNRLKLNTNATVFEQDKVASNGVVHAISRVLLPVSASFNIYQFAKQNLDLFSTLVDLIDRAGLERALSRPGPLTIFAPTNSAFELAQDGDWDDFLNDRQSIRHLLLYHVIPGNVFASDLRPLEFVQSIQGSDIDVSSPGSDQSYDIVLNSESTITERDVLVKNGVFHVVDRVLIPPHETNPTIGTLIEQQGLTTFASAAQQSGLIDTLVNPAVTLTAFVSTNEGFYNTEFQTYLNDDAFHGHLKAAMEYQVVEGVALWSNELTEGLVLNTLYNDEIATVTQSYPSAIVINDAAAIINPDSIASNGVMHVTDYVVIPPFSTVNVVDVIARQPRSFRTMVYLLILTGLIPDLSTGSPYTIFSPTNAAFDDLLNSGLLGASDWASNIDSIREILEYHIVPQVVYGDDLVSGATFTTLNGETISVTTGVLDPVWRSTEQGKKRVLKVRQEVDFEEEPYGGVTINGYATILATDMLAYNGVVHSMDSVLIPSWTSFDNAEPTESTGTADSSGADRCLQWGDFDDICCPTDATARQSSEWYCEYVGV